MCVCVCVCACVRACVRVCVCVCVCVCAAVSKAENNALQERIATLTSHLEKERQENSAMLGGLQLEVERGRSEVTRMEKALSSCGSELTEHLCLAQANRKQQREETDQLRKKVRDRPTDRS